MALEPTETRTFEVTEVGDLNKSPKGHTWIECATDAGTVVFWGGTSNSSNLTKIQRRQAPFTVRCGCRQPLPNYPTHAWWVPDGAPIEFIEPRFGRERERDDDEEERRPSPRAVPSNPHMSSAFRALAREEKLPMREERPFEREERAPVREERRPMPVPVRDDRPSAGAERTLFVVGGSRTTIWDDDPSGDVASFVPAVFAYRGRMVKEWLSSQQRVDAAHWVFLSPRYGFIEPDHPIARHDASFADRQAGSISDEALRTQVQHQRRWNDRIPLNSFDVVYVWSDSATVEDKVRAAFEGSGVKVQRLKALRPAS